MATWEVKRMIEFRTIVVTAVLAMSFLVSAPVFGQSPPASGGAPPAGKPGGGKGAAPGGKERTHTLSFEDELVEGANAKPELFYLFQKKNFNYKRLIKLRENFIPEMRKTSEEVQRGRSPN